jgi:predicted nucleic acid-binding Zn ribbon protein
VRPEEWESPDAVPLRPPPPAVRDLVETLTSTRGWGKRLRGARIHSRWIDIAGEELARHVTPVRLAGGVLVVQAESPAWATQVQYLSGQLRDRANEVLGADEVRVVTVRSGEEKRGRRQ